MRAIERERETEKEKEMERETKREKDMKRETEEERLKHGERCRETKESEREREWSVLLIVPLLGLWGCVLGLDCYWFT
jgi:hypothetical protein